VATPGATGADLRDVFCHALLATDGSVTTDTLVRSATARGFTPEAMHGLYL
jgi:hypothetical protein